MSVRELDGVSVRLLEAVPDLRLSVAVAVTVAVGANTETHDESAHVVQYPSSSTSSQLVYEFASAGQFVFDVFTQMDVPPQCVQTKDAPMIDAGSEE